MPAMTLTEKILARAAGRPAVVPDDNVWVNVDVLMTHDVCGPGTFGIFHQHFGKDANVWDREKVVLFSFRDEAAFRRFAESPEYAEIAVDRKAGSSAVVLLVHGIGPVGA